jgi:hypothetical protein
MGEAVSLTVCCQVAGFAGLRIAPEAVPALRRQPAYAGREPLPPTFLKNADGQTVVGLAAVFQAIQTHGLASVDFSSWGVVAAPGYLGRSHMAQAMHRFRLEGAWGVSPHIVPHLSLHAVAGTVSLALKSHGPNLGIGGGPEAAAEGIMMAATLLAEQRLPGLWVVLTGHAAEYIPPDPARPDERSPDPVECEAAALALVPDSGGCSQLRIRLRVSAGKSNHHPTRPPFTLNSLVTALSHPGEATGSWSLGDTGWVELCNNGVEKS